MKSQNKKDLEKIYLGRKIKIISIKGENDYNGRVGVVGMIDDAMQLHGSWGGLAVILDIDSITVIE